MMLAEMASDCGLPPGVLNVVHGGHDAWIRVGLGGQMALRSSRYIAMYIIHMFYDVHDTHIYMHIYIELYINLLRIWHLRSAIYI